LQIQRLSKKHLQNSILKKLQQYLALVSTKSNCFFMKKVLLIISTGFFMLACQRSHHDLVVDEYSNTILIDASKDGGVWWFPQSGNFSTDAYHQGKALADYLRNAGFKVEEVVPGKQITWSYLSKFKRVIRFGGFAAYAKAEIDAYDLLLSQGASLLIVQDHLQNFSNDALSSHLGLNFSGSFSGTITQFVQHPVTNSVSSLSYIAGSVIIDPDADKISTLGALSISSSQQVTTMGILKHSRSKIFFIGDGNGLEQLPQPFTDNLVKWLF
jgi:hypothetical protein